LWHAGAAKRREFLIRRRWLPLSTLQKKFSEKWLDKVRFWDSQTGAPQIPQYPAAAF
jgi:hypothetical protein